MEILKQISWFIDRLKLMHFSMHKGAEVDLVIEDQKKMIYGIEIKSKTSLKQDDFKGLKKNYIRQGARNLPIFKCLVNDEDWEEDDEMIYYREYAQNSHEEICG